MSGARVWHWLVGLVLLLTGCAGERGPLAVPSSSGARSDLAYREFTLDNGLQVILARDAKAPIVVTMVWYRVGAADEVEGKTGLAHMLEHMMFQGTDKTPPEEYSRIINRLGGDDNAFTSWDFTAYHVKIAADQLDLVLGLEADRMRNLRLSEQEFHSENKVVQEERRTRTDTNPNARMAEKFRREAFRSHPYGRPIIGWMGDVQAHAVADLETFYRRYYAPNNAVLVVAGDVALADGEALVRRHFASLSAEAALPPRHWSQEPPITAARRVEVVDAAARLPLWMAGFRAPSLTGAESEVLALDLLVTLLDGSSGRLHQRLVVEQKLAVSINVSYGGLSREEELLKVSAVPRAGVTMARLEQAVMAELQRAAADLAPERELAKARNSLVAEHVYAQDSVYHLANLIGHLAVNGVDWRLALDYPDRLRAVTAEQVRAVADRYLRPELATIGVLLPDGRAKPKGGRPPRAGERGALNDDIASRSGIEPPGEGS